MPAKRQSGFSLIELLIAITVLGVVTVILTTTLTQTLRGENKVKLINRIKQNSQSVLDKMSNQIRNSGGVICVADNKQVLIIYSKGSYTRFRHLDPSSTDNGRITSETFTASDLALNGESVSPRLCNLIASDYNQVSLTDTDPVNGVSIVGSEVFARVSSSDGYSDIVSINFSTQEAVSAGSVYESNIEPINFSTTVQVLGKSMYY